MAMSMRTVLTAIEQAGRELSSFGEHSKHAGKTVGEVASSIKNVNA
jgi:hypothetical protein